MPGALAWKPPCPYKLLHRVQLVRSPSNGRNADNEPESVEKIIYNEKNLLSEHRRFNNNNELVEITQLTYDERDLPVEKKVLDAKSDVISITTLIYNDKPELVRVTEKNSEGKVTSDIISKYDENGNKS